MSVDNLELSHVNMRPAIRLRQTKTGASCFTKFLLVKKSELRAAILEQLRREMTVQTAAAEMARDEAISEESRPENKWDTHSQEAAYLAEGQAKLAAEIGASIELYTSLPLPDFGPTDAVAVGALVELEGGANRRRVSYFLGPRAGGLEVKLGDRDILVLTPQSPLGRQLIGKRVGDVVQAPGRGSSVAQRIAAVT
jgi:transcription elongation GreA/GreB family factor